MIIFGLSGGVNGGVENVEGGMALEETTKKRQRVKPSKMRRQQVRAELQAKTSKVQPVAESEIQQKEEDCSKASESGLGKEVEVDGSKKGTYKT